MEENKMKEKKIAWSAMISKQYKELLADLMFCTKTQTQGECIEKIVDFYIQKNESIKTLIDMRNEELKSRKQSNLT